VRRWLALLCLLPLVAGAQLLDFSAAERAAIAAHGPWPQPLEPDASNRVQADAAAVALGRRLFFDRRLSAGSRVACASCHQPSRAFQDGRRTGHALGVGVRNTLSLADSAGQRWYGWDGASDSLWAASLRPLLSPLEMAASPAHVASHVRQTPTLAAAHRAVFGALADDDELLFVQVGKALAAFQAKLVSSRMPFDDFRDALVRGDMQQAARYPLAAQRGLRLFIGRGRCNLCHAGPRFSHGEFADAGVPFFVAGGAVDPGRHGGLRLLQANPFNRLGRFADDAGAGAVATRHVTLEPRHFGEFRVPGLRQVARTAPYMHDGSLARLADVVRHYSTLDEERLHADGERILRPLHLSATDAADLETFLRSLSR
jgi:cytochrome c peroxidase